MDLNLQSPKLASRESFGEENLKQLIQNIDAKTVEIDFAKQHVFEQKVTFAYHGRKKGTRYERLK